jgi:hypothetical protein
VQRRDRSKRQILYPDSFLYGIYYSNLPDRYQYPFYALPDTGLDSTEEKHRLSIAVENMCQPNAQIRLLLSLIERLGTNCLIVL